MSIETIQEAQFTRLWHELVKNKLPGTSRARHTQSPVPDIQRFLAQPKCIITEVCRFRRYTAYIFDKYLLPEVCGWLHPQDLPALARTNHQTRSVFMSRESAPHLAAARNPWDYQIGLQFQNPLIQPSYLKQPARFVCSGRGNALH